MSIIVAKSAPLPGYRHFWFWFILALPAAVVVAGLVTVAIAFRAQDSVVRDDWYKDGKAINQSLARDDAAARLGLAAAVTVDALTGDLSVQLRHDTRDFVRPATLTLAFSHPTLAGADQNVALTLRNGIFHGLLKAPLQGRFHVELGSPEWRLRGSREFPQAAFSLRHE
jgi:hypothetical protein